MGFVRFLVLSRLQHDVDESTHIFSSALGSIGSASELLSLILLPSISDSPLHSDSLTNFFFGRQVAATHLTYSTTKRSIIHALSTHDHSFSFTCDLPVTISVLCRAYF